VNLLNPNSEDEKKDIAEALRSLGASDQEVSKALNTQKESPEPQIAEEDSQKPIKSTLKRQFGHDDIDPLEKVSEIQPLLLAVTFHPIEDQEIISYIQENVPPGKRAFWVKQALKTAMQLGASGRLGSGGNEMVVQSFMGQFASMLQQQNGFQRRGQQSMQTRTQGRAGPTPKLKKMDGKPENYKPERPKLDDAMDSIIVG
jgi:hypothetical protein